MPFVADRQPLVTRQPGESAFHDLAMSIQAGLFLDRHWMSVRST